MDNPRSLSEILRAIREKKNFAQDAMGKMMNKDYPERWKESMWKNIEKGWEPKTVWTMENVWDIINSGHLEEDDPLCAELIARTKLIEGAADEKLDARHSLDPPLPEVNPEPAEVNPQVEADNPPDKKDIMDEPGQQPVEKPQETSLAAKLREEKKQEEARQAANQPSQPPPQKRSPWPWVIGIGGCCLFLVAIAALGVAGYFFWRSNQLAKQTPPPPVVIEKEIERVVEQTVIVEATRVVKETVVVEATSPPVEATKPPEVIVVTATPEPVTPSPQPTHSPTRPPSTPTLRPTNTPISFDPIQDDEFPGEVIGPAIVEWWDGESRCGIFALDAAERFTYDRYGHWYRYASQAIVERRYPVHKEIYFSKQNVKDLGCAEGRP